MPWWAMLYLVAFVPFIFYAIWLDFAENKPWWRITAESIACFFEILMFVAVFADVIGTALGLSVIPMLVYAIGWDIYTVNNVLANEKPEDKTTPRDRAVICTGLGLLLLPTYVAGVVLVMRAWKASA
jgi:hypothetical protein